MIDHHLEAFRYATEEEKQKILSALGKMGKVWNENTKTIEDVEPECKFKPFDKVVVRNGNCDKWGIDLFSHYNNKTGLYYCLNGAWDSCLLYNEETSKLINTSNSSSHLPKLMYYEGMRYGIDVTGI